MDTTFKQEIELNLLGANIVTKHSGNSLFPNED